MAVFNPGIPEPTAQSFVNDSRPISPFELKADESGKILSEGAGKLFDETVTAGDKFIKIGLDQTINDTAGSIRDQFTESLEAQRAALTAQTQPAAEQNVPSLLSPTPMQDQAAIPPALASGLDKVTSIGEAGKQGKLGSELDYYGRLNSELKSLRSNYPGYRDYIDEKMKAVTGVDPANAVVKANLDYISNATAKMNADKNRVLTVLDREDNLGIPGLPTFRRAVLDGRPGAEDAAISFVNKYRAKFEANKAALSDDEVALKGDDVQKRVAARALTSHIITMAASHNEGVNFGSNMKPDDLLKYAQDIQARRVPAPSTEQMRDLAVMNDQNTATLTQAIRNWAAMPQKALGGSSIREVHGDEAVDKMIENGLSGQKVISKAFLDKDLGTVDRTKRGIEAITNDDSYRLLRDGYGDRDVQTMTRLQAASKNLFSPNAKGYIDMSNMTRGLSAHMDNLYKTMGDHSIVADLNKHTGEPSTAAEDIAYSKSKTIGDADSHVATPAEASTFYNGIVNRAKLIGDPDMTDEGARHLVDYYFKPQNSTNIYKLGETPEEKMNMVKTMTDSSITDKVARMDKTRQTYYRTWAETSYGVAVRPYLLQLQSLSSTPWLHQGWDNDKHEVVVTGTPPKGVVEDTTFSSPYADQGILQRAKDLAAKINDGLHNVSHIEESTKGDVNAYLVNLLHNNGLTLENSKLMQGVVQSGRAPVKPDETKDTFGNKVKGKAEDRVFSSPQ